MTPPPEDAKRKVLAGWLARAKADLDVAEHLLAEGAEFSNAVASELQDIIILTPYGVELRYPGDRPDASPNEARQAAQLAQKVRDAVVPLLPDTSMHADT